MAILLLVSGMALAFISFAFTFTIATGSLIYISEAFMTAGGIFGVSIYFKSKLGEYGSNVTKQIERMIEDAFNKHKDDFHE
jgi:hypothetical protein